jgi:hypothetical protein
MTSRKSKEKEEEHDKDYMSVIESVATEYSRVLCALRDLSGKTGSFSEL